MSDIKSVPREALDVLEDEIKLIKTNEGAIYLVGPIQLPVNLLGETVQFQWYCWLNSKEEDIDTKQIIENLSSANLAEY